MSKCEKEALKCRLEGNKLYKKKEFNKAIDLYNNSLRSCQFGDSHYFFAMGNKSALLFETRKFKQSKDIIEFMFASETFSVSDKKFIQKLNDRRESCYMQLKLQDKVTATFEKPKSTDCQSSSCFNQPFVNTSLFTKNLSSFGCAVVTSNNLKPNETMYQMKPFAAVLGVPFWTDHCYTCFKCVRDSIIVPCDGCSEVQFCSISCHDENKLHLNYECKQIGFVKEIGLLHLSVTILWIFLMNQKLDDLLQVYNGKEDKVNASYQRFNEQEFQFINLCSSLSITKSFQASNQIILQTIFRKLFSNLRIPTLTSEVCIYTLAAITVQMLMNASTITFYDELSCSNLAIGSGIYPAIAMMNHSCNSNTVCLFNGTTATVKTTQSVVRGSQLFNSYGLDFESAERSTRQESLKMQYDFDCCCSACALDWRRNDNVRVIVCQSCSATVQAASADAKCKKCSWHAGPILLEEVTILEGLYEEAFNCFQKSDYKKGLQVLTSSDSIARMEILQMPDPLLIDWNDLVRKFIIRIFDEDI